MSQAAQPSDRNTGNPTLVEPDNRPLLLILMAGLLILLLSQWRYPPSNPRPDSIPDDQFSSARAFAILESLIGEETPHPAGSEQNRIVRERIKSQLTAWGYQPFEHRTTSNNVPLVNVMTRLEGSEGDAAIMLACHHDSVRQGPGAADDGAALAALLEVMRMLREQPQRKHDVILLITDGEELGLLGAERFVAEHDWANEVDVVLNFEARGTSGPSCMFETAENNLQLVRSFAEHAPHPRTSSLFYEVYKYLPNDTDFTIFKEAGMQGLNFAFIGDVKNYHTPDDDLAHLDRGSLQHHGENAWSMVMALSNADLTSLTEANDNAIYFDLFGWTVLVWPQKVAVPFAALASAITFVALARMLRLHPPQSTHPAIFAFGIVFLAVGTISWVLLKGLSMSTIMQSGWPARPMPIMLSVGSAGVLVLCGLAYLCRRDHYPSVQAGIWIGFSALAMLTAWKVPGGSYFFVVPLIVGGLLGYLLATPSHGSVAATGWPIGLLTMMLPVERLFYDALGFTSPLMIAIRFGLLGVAIFPQLLLCSSRVRAGIVFASVSTFVIGLPIALLPAI